MKKWRKWLTILVSVTFFVGCGGVAVSNVDSSKKSVNKTLKYKGPKARIAVASFKCKAAKCNGEIGSSIADMLTTELVKSGKFIVVEREALNAINQEYNLNTAMNQPIRNLEGADILIVGAITAFEPKAGGITTGGFVVPKNIPFLGGIKLGKNEAYIALDLRLIDVRTGRVIAATTVEGKTSDWKIGGLGGGISSVGIVGGGLSTYKNTPMEKAIRVMIAKAVKEIERLVPEDYYRYNGNATPVNLPSNSSTAVAAKNNVQKNNNYKLIFKEDFEKYGVGQTPPFGPWVGDKKVSVTMGVQKNKQIGKILKVWEYNKICNQNLKVKNAIFTVDFIRNIVFYFRVVNKNPFVGYLVSAFAHNGEVNLEKVAGDIKIKVAQNNIQPNNSKWHTIKIVANNSHIKVFMDDKLAIDINDNDNSLQKAGFICLEGSCCDSYFDNIQVFEVK